VVVGVLENKRVDTQGLEISQQGDINDGIMIPIECIWQRMRHHSLRSRLDEIQLQMESEDQLFDSGLSVRRMLSVLHYGVEDVDLFVPLDMLKAKQESQKLLELLSIGICGISLLVGGIGIMNIMLASVSERMKEIGIRRAIGALKGDIQKQFLCESVLISFVGSLVGLVLAMLAVALSATALDLPIVFSIPLMAISVILAMATGMIFGFFPAKSASENNVIEVLRND
jgi:ABC-type antimicrobial peptide transport system permease subunit